MNQEQPDKWFVEPRGNISHANEVIAKFLKEEVDECPSYRGMQLCADGREHPLWELPSFIDAGQLWKSKYTLQIEAIKIWCRGKDGKIRIDDFLVRNRRTPGVKRIIAKIKARKNNPEQPK